MRKSLETTYLDINIYPSTLYGFVTQDHGRESGQKYRIVYYIDFWHVQVVIRIP